MEDPVSPGQVGRRAVRLGFVPLSDCAPLAVACETGIFGRYGLQVELCREAGWSAVRDKILSGELDAAQSIAGIAFALGMGWGGMKCEVAVPLILNPHGSAVTLSRDLDPAWFGSGEGLAERLAGGWRKDRPLTLAATHRYSSHHILLHTWLNRHGLSAPDQASIVFMQPDEMPGHLKDGLIDGYCVGEPWNSAAILSGHGWCAAATAELARGHPEKVLLVAGRFLTERRDEAVAMVAALIEACRLCQTPAFRSELVSILAMKPYIGTSPEVLRHRLEPESSAAVTDAATGSDCDAANRPTVEKASWVLAGLRRIGVLPNATCGSLTRIYREDVFHAALHGCPGI